ncbi:MAG TPA: hypothetical protein DHW71_05965 [Gammaproteobacteria bacterium]|nr:hypothetical protein [Gammaproteobacteria bacterium]HBF09406.1 hypothetical protein [Gammaproteobacteria bacterium]HCK92510.1 hypothetical protein [Gammaproteobacteria bacterium]|tara:strand:- start:360 stop:1049 length:690 start_codon:yes stop_codon:yes gene_type:complete
MNTLSTTNSAHQYKAQAPMMYQESEQFEPTQVTPSSSKVRINGKELSEEHRSNFLADVQLFAPKEVVEQINQPETRVEIDYQITPETLNNLRNKINTNTEETRVLLNHIEEGDVSHNCLIQPYVTVYNTSKNLITPIMSDYMRICRNMNAEREHSCDGPLAVAGGLLTHLAPTAVISAVGTGIAGTIAAAQLTGIGAITGCFCSYFIICQPCMCIDATTEGYPNGMCFD